MVKLIELQSQRQEVKRQSRKWNKHYVHVSALTRGELETHEGC